jgi:phosphoglycerate dehydrogenase-like enzyme
MIRAPEESWLAGAGLDVNGPEPLPKNSPLLKMDNVVLSPRRAAHPDEPLSRMALVVMDSLGVIKRRKPASPVPPPA